MVAIGLFGVTMGSGAHAGRATEAARLAEELGYDSVWTPEHAVLPSPRTAASPLDPDFPILDPLIALAHVAASTTRIRLATGVVLVPQHQPVLLSKQLVTLDQLSGGRLLFGVGVGYLEPELAAAGVRMAERGARADEYLAALHALWSDERPGFRGEHVRLEGVDAHPRPVNGTIPIVVGGTAPAAYRRVMRYRAGWYGFMLDREETSTQVGALRAALQQAGCSQQRPEISVTPTEALTSQVVADYAALGVDRLVVCPPRGSLWRSGWTRDRFLDFVRANAPGAIA